MLKRFDRHFVLGLFMFLNFEVAARRCFTNLRRDVVATQRRFVGDINFAAERTAGRQRQFFLENLSAVRIFDRNSDSFFVEQLVTFASPLSQDAFEVNLLRRSIDGPVGVDVARQVLARKQVHVAAFATEIEVDVRDDKVVAVTRHNQIRV